jgi:hypothetical protein
MFRFAFALVLVLTTGLASAREIEGQILGNTGVVLRLSQANEFGHFVTGNYWFTAKTEIVRNGKPTKLDTLKAGEKVKLTVDNKSNISKIVLTGEIDKKWLDKRKKDAVVAQRNAVALRVAAAQEAAMQAAQTRAAMMIQSDPLMAADMQARAMLGQVPTRGGMTGSMWDKRMEKLMSSDPRMMMSRGGLMEGYDYIGGRWVPHNGPGPQIYDPEGRSLPRR